MKKTILLLFLLLSSFLSIGQKTNSDDNLIPWSKDRKLKWSDFQGEKDNKNLNSGTMKAGCCAAIQATGYYENEILKYRVTNNFDKSLSWTTHTTSLQLLEHEQIHFDIAEIFTRKIRNGIEQLIKEKKTTVKDYSLLINGLLKEKEIYNSKYDKETDHGKLVETQNEWKVLVAIELKKLEMFEADNSR
ncbi:DUF922 domain-containing protein [Marinifilum caeruleilacunae]|uniref:DUF922 domain-containing protein n=1 Tax=Marinifilum caeruleilacunae TaxID=2499076 RepID=A0ABX1X1P6_9BACT|nr:DUF922 domain-containing protein [Marinifilum caeruleilacunae]NOU62337.1 DUF922 domain-containing protein [Marinifilum caeruleilacunae]